MLNNGTFALLLRTVVMYPASGLLAGWFGFVTFDEATGVMMVDINAVSLMIAALIWSLGTGGTFAWSRLIKKNGGAT